MTIQLLQTWNGVPAGVILSTGDAATEAALVANGTASYTTTTGNPYVPNDPYSAGQVAPSMTWAARKLASLVPGMQVRFSDVGGGSLFNGGGNVLFSTGTRWKPVNGSILLDAIDTANIGVANTTEQQLNPNHVVIPAGLIAGFDRLRVFLAMSKSGGADTSTIRLRFGPLGTVADPVIATITSLATTMQSLGSVMQFKRASATTLQKQGSGDPNLSYDGASTTPYPAAVTISNLDTTPMYLTVSAQMTGGTEFTTLQDLTFELLATDS
jgi:hypothetical protein